MKKIAAALLAASLLILPAHAAGAGPVDAAAAVLMEKETGTILFEQNAHDKLEPASVTKIMTLLLIMEALDSGRIARDDMVTVSAYAAGMGGSQVYLKEIPLHIRMTRYGELHITLSRTKPNFTY